MLMQNGVVRRHERKFEGSSIEQQGEYKVNLAPNNTRDRWETDCTGSPATNSCLRLFKMIGKYLIQA